MDLAVDGGQSGLRVGVVERGAITRVMAGAGYHDSPNADPSDTIIGELRRTCGALALDRPIRRAVLGLTGAPPDPIRRRQLAKLVREAVQAAQVWVAPDMITAHAGALGGIPGVVIAAGTGAVAFGTDGRTAARADGYGYMYGDDGSGYAVGRAAVRAALRAGDNRGPATALSAAVTGHFETSLEFPRGLYRRADHVALVASLAPVVADVASQGDAVAVGIWHDAAAELALTVASVLRRCFPGAGTSGVPVSYCGGLFAIGDLLLVAFRQALSAHCPEADVRVPLGDPLDGAARLANAGLGIYADQVTVCGPGDQLLP